MRGPVRITAGSDGLRDELAGLWQRVTEAGGALGFDRGDPPPAMRAAATEVAAGLDGADEYLYVVFDNAGVRGFVRCRRVRRPIQRHTARVCWLAVHPGFWRHGWGTRLLEHAVAAMAADGVTLLTGSARAEGAGQRFALARGFTERGRIPGAVRLADGSVRDEVLFSRALC